MPSNARRPLPAARRAAALLAIAGALGGTAQAIPEPSARAYENALQRYEKNDLPGAVVELKNALQADRKNLAAHLLMGRVLLQASELKAAEASLEEALRQGVSKTEVFPLLGQVYLQLGETRKLLDTITLAEMPPGLHAEILTLRGTAMGMSGNLGGASQAFAEARAADARSPLPLIAEAPLLLRSSERDKARATALKATELGPQNAMAWYQYGVVLQALGDAAGALAAFDKGIAINGKHVDSRVSRAAALLALKRDAEAGTELKLLKDAKVIEPRASFLRALLAAQRGDAAAAKADYTEAANLIDVMTPAIRNGSEPLLLAGALSHRALGNPQKAREYLDALLARNGRHFAALTLMGELLLETGDLNRAATVLEPLLQAQPNDPQLLFMMGNLHLARRQYAPAAEMLERATKAGGSSAALRDLSFSQFGLGNNVVALANLERAVAQNPKDLRAAIELAIVYARMGQTDKALKAAEALVKQDPGNLAMVNFLGNVRGRLGDLKGTRAAYEQALAKDPKFRPVIMNISWLDIDEGRYDEARNRLKAHLKEQPKDPDVLFQLGVLEQRARRPAEAQAYWTEADKVQQKDPRPGLALVDLFLGQRQMDSAVATAKLVAGRYPDALPVQLVLARALLQAGDAGAARQTLQAATLKAGFDPELLVQIGRLQLGAGNPDGATQAAAKALQSNPNDVGALALTVEAAGRRGNAAEIDRTLAALQARHPSHPLTLTTAGHVAFSRGQLPKAVTAYRTAFDKAPSSPLALTLAQAYVAGNEGAKALALLEGWSAKQPRDLIVLRALAELQVLQGKADAARRSYDSILKADPDDPAALAGYADVLHRLNDPAALGMAEKAHKLAPQNAGLAAAYGRLLVERGDAEAGVRILREARLREPANGQVRWQLAAALAKVGRQNEARDELRAAIGSAQPPAAGPELERLKGQLGL